MPFRAPPGRDIPLDELPRWSPWPARLLGLEPWERRDRTTERVLQEYDVQHYGRLLEMARAGTTPESLRRSEMRAAPTDATCVSVGNALRVTTMEEAVAGIRESLRYALEGHVRSGTVVELGCGYGYNLAVLADLGGAARLAGGELSANAVALAARVQRSDIEVRRFDFRRGDDYAFLAALPRPVTVFTSHALEQLPSAAPFLENLRRVREHVDAVVHLEPSPEVQDDGLLGMLRRQYIEANDYNRDLLSCLREADDVRLDVAEPNFFGRNPLNPTTLFRWSFRNA